MKLCGKELTLLNIFFLILYYGFCRYLPSNSTPIIGQISKRMRYVCCKHIFKYCGKNVNIERKAFFASGSNLCIGDNSGLGINAYVPADTIIGKNVMMGPDCYILGANHETKRLDIPMIQQGFCKPKQTIIEDDVWIGDGVIMTPGRIIKKGSIIAARCVLCKDFPEYSVVGGNPSRLIHDRREAQ